MLSDEPSSEPSSILNQAPSKIQSMIVALHVQEESMGQQGGVKGLTSIIATQKMFF
jgi:hypothetical protein